MAKKSKARRRPVQIEVRKSGVHGRGVYAAQFIPEGTRIIEYTGERVSWEAAPDDDDDPHTFNFGLENGEVINPEVGGNDARWINHSCDPNCETVEEDDRIFIDALRDITEATKKKFACHCGAANCRGTMIELQESCE
jgi:SET domain-containing protein